MHARRGDTKAGTKLDNNIIGINIFFGQRNLFGLNGTCRQRHKALAIHNSAVKWIGDTSKTTGGYIW